jgi:phosphatidylinositol-3-phosphatase
MKKLIKLFGIFIFVPLIFLAIPATTYAQTSSLTNIKHVFVIFMENTDWSSVTPSNAPYIWNTLIPAGSHANNYHNIATSLGSLHPSEPNYIWFEGGTNSYSDFTFTNDNDASGSNSTSATAHLATLLNNSGKTWKAYQESMSQGICPISSSGNYAAKHNPFVFFKDVSGNPPSTSNSYCISHASPLTTTILANDLASGNVANYNFLTPNLCNDMHDCSITTGDTWLANTLPTIMNSNLYK